MIVCVGSEKEKDGSEDEEERRRTETVGSGVQFNVAVHELSF